LHQEVRRTRAHQLQPVRRRAIAIRRLGLAAAALAPRRLPRRAHLTVTLGEDLVRPALDAACDRHEQAIHQPTRLHVRYAFPRLTAS
jgi:hypothetical protein